MTVNGDHMATPSDVSARSWTPPTRACTTCRPRRPGPAGSLPLDRRDAARLALRRFVRAGAKRRHGLEIHARWSGRSILLLSTQGGIRADDGTPVALGYHTGHWEVGLLVQQAARTLKQAGAVPFAAYCSDPCDGRTQGTVGMFDSLPYRNDAAIVFRRLIRSLPTRRGVLGVATCDKGLPAMMLALAGCGDLPCVLVPGGVSLPPSVGEDAGKIQSIGAATPTVRSRWKTPPSWAAARALRPAAVASSWARPPRRRSWPKRWAWRCRTRRWRRAGSRSGSTWRIAAHWRWRTLDRRGIRLRDILTDAADSQRHGRTRGLRRLDQSAAAHSGHCPCRGTAAADGGRLAGSEHPRAAVRRRAAQRAGRASHRASVPGRRRAGDHVALARVGVCWTWMCSPSAGCTLGEVLDWWEASPRSSGRARNAAAPRRRGSG